MTEMQSNLSKIKPKLRTEGRISGNFGKNKVKAGSALSDIGVTSSEKVRITSRDTYINRMLQLYHTTNSQRMKRFAVAELHKLNYFKVQRLDQSAPTAQPYRTPGC